MVCKCCVPGCKSNYESAGKEGRYSTSDVLVAEWLRVRLRVRIGEGSTLTVGNFLSLENLNVIIRAIN